MTFIVLVVHYPVLVVQYNDPRTRMFEQIMDKIMVKHPEQNLFGHLHQRLWHPNGRPRIGLTDLFEHSAWTAIWVDAFRYSILYPLKDMFKYLWLEITCVFNHWYLIWCCLMIFTIYFHVFLLEFTPFWAGDTSLWHDTWGDDFWRESDRDESDRDGLKHVETIKQKCTKQH